MSHKGNPTALEMNRARAVVAIRGLEGNIAEKNGQAIIPVEPTPHEADHAQGESRALQIVL
jgi:hypothetical protein